MLLNLALAQVFGAGATQDATTLTIRKSDLPGLTAAVDNRGEQLLVAFLLQLHQQFKGILTDEQGRTITDEQERKINFDNSALYEKLNIFYWKRQFITRSQESYILDTFIIEAFVNPPTPSGSELDPDLLDY
jgi:hypothetical protein